MKSSGLTKCVEWKWEKDASEVNAGAREKCDMFHWSAAAVKVVNTHRLRADGIRRVHMKTTFMDGREARRITATKESVANVARQLARGGARARREQKSNSNGTLSGRHAEHGNNEYFVHRKRMERASIDASALYAMHREHTPLQRGRD